MRSRFRVALLLTVLGTILSPGCHAVEKHWVVSWGTSPAPAPTDAASARKEGLELDHQTLREIVHLSIGGPMVRVRLSNVFGKESLRIGSAHVALRGNGSSIARDSDHVLTFSGVPEVTIPPNAIVLSDPVPLVVRDGSDLAISLFIPGHSTGAAVHYLALQTSYVGEGDLTSAGGVENAHAITSWMFLAGVDVSASPRAAAIAVFGDSRVDGDGSTQDANWRWPDSLAQRLSRQGLALGVLNAGIIGNRILRDSPPSALELGPSGLARFERDALDAPGVKYVIVLAGVVDIDLPGTPYAPASAAVSAEDVIWGMKQLIERAHERGVRVFLATQTPFGGANWMPNIYSDAKNAQRQALNAWIRSGKGFDGVIDFEPIVRDPSDPGRLRPDLDSGDHIHPNDVGYAAMAEAIDLRLFR
jgi:lysophospholipase L1-like esterase